MDTETKVMQDNENDLNEKKEKYSSQDLKHAKRQDLVKMLYKMKIREIKLEEELADVKQQLEERRIVMEESGSIAEAALKVNRIFEVAQASADDYLSMIQKSNEESAKKLQTAEEESARILQEAEKKAEELLRDAEKSCKEQYEKNDLEIRAKTAEAERRIQEVEENCAKKIKDTDSMIAERLGQFDEKVKKTLDAYAELQGFLFAGKSML